MSTNSKFLNGQWGSNWAIDSLRGTRPAENNILDKEIIVKIIN
jgi:hypothetical protein